jgi:hypothetical protein
LFFLWWIMREACQADDAKKTYEVAASFIWFFLFFLQHQLDHAVHIHSLCNSKVCWWQWMDVHNRVQWVCFLLVFHFILRWFIWLAATNDIYKWDTPKLLSWGHFSFHNACDVKLVNVCDACQE